MNDFFNKIKQHYPIRGIVQVGANIGQEIPLFKQHTNDILCFEPLPQQFQTLVNLYPFVTAYNYALGDKNEIKDMHFANNNGASSSFLKPNKHTEHYDYISFSNIQNIRVKRFDNSEINLHPYNVLVSDTQGYEIQVLLGFGSELEKIDAIIIEYNNCDLYYDNATLTDITNYLSPFGFELIEKQTEAIDWGNALYIKKKA